MATAAKPKADPAHVELRDRIGAVPPAEAITWINAMVHGETGVGKTHLIGTAQDHPLTSPVLIADVDGGVTTLRKRRDIDVVPVRKFTDLISLYRDLRNAIPKDGSRFPYGTIAIDTFSEFQSLDLADIAAAMAKLNDNLDEDIPDQRAYGKSLSHMRDIIRVYRDLPCNTIFTCHTNTERDNDMKMIYEPKLTGQMKKLAPGFFDIVGYYFAEVGTDKTVTRSMQFMRTTTTVAKDRTGAFDPIEINPTIPILWEKLQATNEGEK